MRWYITNASNEQKTSFFSEKSNSKNCLIFKLILIGKENLATFLIEKGANIHSTNHKLSTPIHLAAHIGEFSKNWFDSDEMDEFLGWIDLFSC